MSTQSDIHGTGPVRAVVPAPRTGGGTRRTVPAGVTWPRRYARAVVVSDVASIVVSVVVGIALARPETVDGVRALIGTGVAAGLLLALGLAVVRAWDPLVLHVGSSELRRVYQAVFGSAAALGLVGLGLDVESVRPWVFLAMPGAGALCLLGRYAARKRLHAERHAGRCMRPVLAVGSVDAVADLVRRTRRDPYFGWDVVGACVPQGTTVAAVEDVPVLGDLDAVAGIAGRGAHRVVAVAPAPGWGPGRLRELAWRLEGTGVELAVDPGLMEIAGPRLHIAPIDGLPLLRLSQPTFTGGRWLLKQTIDRVGAGVLLAVSAPVLLAIAFAVRSDGGPALFRQERVGVNGRTFRMVKFRSMVVDADRRVAALAARNDGAGPLFKMRHDPRITRVGAVLRRYSLDELPQLFNVLAGSMSLVGPRPPLAREVAAYGDDARRRLLVRPGMTGLWQVSGRSDLSWSESVRLDLRYVENWSLALDAEIAWKTVGAVFGSRGAY
ncbi:sugar transferase [Pseudonocardia oceani]|uniref:sugar transferase n=1 Tax=Pseudonocardia oceani TaxID=2792013 RepID=UPI001CF687C4|nr:sugar transferase [Pseudonocardia oceani]